MSQNYKYLAVNNRGREVSGVIAAANQIDLEYKLSTIGLTLIDCKVQQASFFSISAKITPQDIIILCIQLEQLDNAGVPLLDAIADLRDAAENQRLKDILTTIYDSIHQGKMLSEALRDFPAVFDEIFIGLISAGEKTGNLGMIFAHLSTHLKWTNELKEKIKKASYYPTFLLIIMGGIVALMMNFVIPQLSKFLIAQGFELPIHTRALIATSEFFQASWHILILIPIISIGSLIVGRKISENFRYNTDNFSMQIPVIGITIRKIEIARFCRFFALTYRSGIPILECLDISSNTISNLMLKESIYNVQKGVADGQTLTQSLYLTNQFPSMVVRMIKVGEDSGNLEAAFDAINFFYDREVNEAVNSMIAAIQPTLTIVLGGIMAWVATAVFGPLYASLSKISF
ncbi:type II secretion system F family protein [Rickettsiales endosymbiont of Stachyamoeba lipophora]|uniref:type II secretion system F family protein n=1 Tax=Rickettsiales endosymbiont of Stachyamoeba lipophora TaxID=2486578 RepID=UPI000F652721|nr:type II secretion system F family protein [Rickettsiales endosymbiont of Stachyamoeba lipophora]AZL15416.1 type II secretion system F family protein [Rickettsiales endosymbiont of Stachyamoeba lipophora]